MTIYKLPHYPLKDIKGLTKTNQYKVNEDVLQALHNKFMWDNTDVAKVILKLNDRWHRDNPLKNHFYKTAEHKTFPNTKVDTYKILNSLEGYDLYTHFYIRIQDGILIINSFKEL